MKKIPKTAIDLFDRNPEPPRPQREVTLFEEPDDDVLVLGLIMQDAELIDLKLRGSVRKTTADYRGDLRVIIGAADRIKKRCARLLHERDAGGGGKTCPLTTR